LEPSVPLLLLFPKLRGSFRVAVCRASRGSKWQDGGARETERRREEDIGGAVRRVFGVHRGCRRNRHRRRGRKPMGEQKSGEDRVKIEKEGEE